MANRMRNRSLLEGVLRGKAAHVTATKDLKAAARRTWARDLGKIGVVGAVADTLIRRTFAALNYVLDDDGVSLDDKAAACLIAERVLMAGVPVFLGVLLAEEEQQAPTHD